MTDRNRGRGDQRGQIGKDQLVKWKRALADQNRQQRNRRGKRPPAQITGIRWTPDVPGNHAGAAQKGTTL